MISYYTPTSNNEVVAPNDVNTQAGTVRADFPTPTEEQALLAYEELYRQPELAIFVKNAQDRAVITPAVWSFEDELERREMSDLPNAQDHAINSALSQGFVVDESTECFVTGCSCSRHQA